MQMPQQKRPITERAKDHDESTGNPPDRHGTHKERDEALPGNGGDKAGLDKYTGAGGVRQNSGTPKGR
jgi:hypothetical protein